MEILIEHVRIFVNLHLASLLWIAAVIFGGRFILKLIAQRILSQANDGNDEIETGKEKRAKTLADLMTTTGKVVIFVTALIAMLQILGIDPVPVLAGASVLGFAVGFGAQTLIKDFLAGILIFTENQFAVGDKVKIGSFEGTIYKMSMRSTVVLDKDGNFIFIPNGTITSVVNSSLGEHRKKNNPPV